MLQENVERRPIKLHPRLEGKRMLFSLSAGISVNSLIQRFLKEKIELNFEQDPFGISYHGQPISLCDYIQKAGMDALIIHPEPMSEWISEIESAKKIGIPVVIIETSRNVKPGSGEMYDRFETECFQIVHLGRHFNEILLNILDKEFAKKVSH